jgi:hypothetical protein
MMNQEMYVRINDLQQQDWTFAEIAAETGFHPVTIKNHLAAGGPPAKQPTSDEQRVMNGRWRSPIEELIQKWPRLLVISVLHRLRAEGLEGGCVVGLDDTVILFRDDLVVVPAADLVVHHIPGPTQHFRGCGPVLRCCWRCPNSVSD